MNTEATKIKPRKSLLAALMSLCLPGLGQLYNGRINKACWFFLSFTFFSVPAFVISILYLPAEWMVNALTVTLFMCGFIWIYGALDAFVEAMHNKQYMPQAWQGAGVYLLVLVAMALIILPQMAAYMRTKLVEPYRIPSASMEPTLVAGDFIFADKRYNCASCKHEVQHGDVVVFTFPNNRNVNYIKRVIGLPGDRVQIRGEIVKVNGDTISAVTSQQNGLDVVQEKSGNKSWVVIWKKVKSSPQPVYDITVPQGQVFVLGDNRNESNDSRFFDTVPLSDVKARARQIWMSYNKKLGGLRMDRAGKVIQ
ncbi:MAG: signal peptidase I [Thiolinea sp.]